MHITSIIISAILAVGLGSYAWTQDGEGNWVANNTNYTINGGKYLPPSVA